MQDRPPSRNGGEGPPSRNGGKSPQDQPPRIPRGREAHNRRAFLSVGLGVAVALLIASVMPGPLVLAAFREILFFAALGVGVVAAIRREPLWGAPLLTGWDRSVMMLLIAQISGWFVDAEAVESYLRRLQETGQL